MAPERDTEGEHGIAGATVGTGAFGYGAAVAAGDHDASRRRQGARIPRAVSLLGGVATGACIVVLLVATGALVPDRVVRGADAMDDLVAAWRRHRSATVVVDGVWRRTRSSDGEVLESATLLVQRPPDLIVRRLGGVTGQVDGKVIRCTTDLAGEFGCEPSTTPAGDYDADVEDEVEALRSAGAGPRPMYGVSTEGDGCFELVLLATAPDPPYGRRGTLCFDDRTGALRYLRRDLGRIVEEQEALAITDVVSDDDFDLDPDPDYDTSLPGVGPS